MGRKGKKSNPVRSAAEFDVVRMLESVLRHPHISPTAFAWSLTDILTARDEQTRGVFKRPAQLARSMRTDDALFTAYRNRLAPLRALEVQTTPARKTAPAMRIADEADALYGPHGSALSRETIACINGDIADHGVAFAINDVVVREDGSRVDLAPRYWPIEFTRWDPTLRCYTTQIDWSDPASAKAGLEPSPFTSQVPIVHGNGQWIIFTAREHEPWAHDAALLPAALVWAARGYGIRDWAKNSYAHGSAKMMGELPEGIQLTDADGTATPEAAAYLGVLHALMGGDALVGLRPHGAKSEWLVNASTNWQVFKELVTDRDRSAARIYLGTDGTLGAQGGAPGVDISALFGIATTIMQGDAECIEKALYTGLLQPWCAINFGDSSLAPKRLYLLPDSDSERWTDDFAKRNAAFHEAVQAEKRNGFEVTQERVNELAKRYRVPAPTLKVQAQPEQTEQPKPTNGAPAKPNGATTAPS